MDQNSRHAFKTEHNNLPNQQNLTFRDFLLLKNNQSKIKALPNIKNQRWQKQLSTLLSGSQTSIHFQSPTSQIQIPISDLLKQNVNVKSQEQSPYTQKMLPLNIADTTNFPLGDLVCLTPTHFKFNPKNKSNFRSTHSQRNCCFEQLDYLRKHTKPQHRSIGPMMTQHEIIHQFFQTKVHKYKTNLKPFGTTERLDYEAETLYNRITCDRLLRAKYVGRNVKHLREIYRSVLGVGYDKEVLMDPTRMRAIHASLFIRKDQFIRFKYLFLNQYMEMETPCDLLFKGCHRIENLKPLILNQPLDFEIFGCDQGIDLIAMITYDKIFKDYTLSPFFKAVDIDEQAAKFAKLFAQLIDHTESPNYTLETLRERHVKYKLTHVQLANFKFYLSTSLQQLKIRFKSIRNLLRNMDTYKFAILNKNSLQESIQNQPGGFRDFIDYYVRLCLQDPLLFDLIQKRGKPRFTAHCENMFQYFFRGNVKAITRDDIDQVHKNKCVVSEITFNKLREKALLAIQKVTKDSLVISDFVEDWEEVAPFILGNSRHLIIKNLGGQQMINALAHKIEFEIQQRPILNKVFEDNESSLEQNLKCKLNLILYGVHFYKRTDIEVLHKRLRILEQPYYEFQQVIKNVLLDVPQLEWINDVLEDYKKHIVLDL